MGLSPRVESSWNRAKSWNGALSSVLHDRGGESDQIVLLLVRRGSNLGISGKQHPRVERGTKHHQNYRNTIAVHLHRYVNYSSVEENKQLTLAPLVLKEEELVPSRIR